MVCISYHTSYAHIIISLRSTIGFLEGIASLGPGNDAMPKCEVGHFQNRLESYLVISSELSVLPESSVEKSYDVYMPFKVELSLSCLVCTLLTCAVSGCVFETLSNAALPSLKVP